MLERMTSEMRELTSLMTVHSGTGVCMHIICSVLPTRA